MSGTCTPWLTGAELLAARPDISSFVTDPTGAGAAAIAAAAQDASDWLYVLSGRQFNGACSGVLRPTARPQSWTVQSWNGFLQSLHGFGYSDSWGSWYGDNWNNPPSIDLGVFPIRSIDVVKIDGAVIPSDEYRVDNQRYLVRTRPTLQAVPTERSGWPTRQAYDLPDTEAGTFSVAVSYGAYPPGPGVAAAIALAYEFVLSRSNKSSKLPARVTQITRAGVQMALLDPMQFLDDGLTGIYEADLFIRTYNPGKNKVRPAVWSPDRPSVVRPGTYGS